jgi:hypothetical protein
MSQILSTLKSGSRAALVALALGAASFAGAATPAMAQPTFNFDFGISGGDSNFSFQMGKGGVRIKRACLDNNEIRRGLSRSGFNDIRIGNRRGNKVQVVAEWRRDGRDYSMNVDRCTGRVTDIQRVRGGWGNGPRRPGGGGFGLQFQFGN